MTGPRNPEIMCVFSMKSALIIVCCLCSHLAFGQIKAIQWASSLEYQFNQYQDFEYSGQQALGPPDAFPPGSINKNAFRLKSQNEFGTLKLRFSNPTQVQQVIIIENHKPGRVAQVKLIDEQGFNYIIYQQETQAIQDKFRTMVLSLPQTNYRVAAIEININSITANGYSQIDAVGILEKGTLEDVRNILSGANYNVQQDMTFTAKKEILHDNINSNYTEAKPLVSHDGNTLYFSRLFHPDNTNGKLDQQDIYMSRLIHGQWSPAENAGRPLNDGYSNGVCSISPDGSKLLVINGYLPNGEVTPGVSISHHTASGWCRPIKLNIQDYENHSEFQDFFLSADERVMIMAVEREEGLGDQDLYVSIKTSDKNYSKPMNLGLHVNTSKAEFAPFLSSDNTTLYFSSDGHGGFGQSDIFKTKRLDDTWQNWAEPQNVGPSVNTSSWDAYFSITATGDYAYFVSSADSRNGQENIYRIPLLQDNTPEKSDGQVAFQGQILDAVTGRPVNANVILENSQTMTPYRTASDILSGNFIFYLPTGSDYQLNINATGYIAYLERIDFGAKAEIRNLYRKIFLKPIQSDQIFTLDNLQFERGKPNLLEHSYPILEKLVEIMLENPEMKIELGGHTDGLGSSNAKETLSYQRVEKIKEFLVGFGIDRKRVETVGYGGSKPIAPNDTEENRAKNRRVEIKVLDVGA